MPNGRRESYEAVPRRPEQQGTEGPAHSKNPMFSVPLLPCLKQTLSCLSPLLLPELVHLLPCLSHTLPLSQTYPVLSQPSVTHQTCSSVTLSFSYPTPISNIPCPCISPLLLPELVHLLPCLSHTLSPYPPYPVPLSSLPCPYPVTKKVKPYSFTFFFFPLLSLLIRSRAVTTKTYFVCPP